MNALRRTTIALFCAAAALALANWALFVNHPTDEPAAEGQALSGWQRWQALDPAERVSCVQRYQAVNRRADARKTWRHAREFGRFSAAEQDRLRDVLGVLRDTLDQQPPTRRRDLLRAPARVRAYEVYRALLAEDPARVAQLRSTWTKSP